MRIFITTLCLLVLGFYGRAEERTKSYEKKISKGELEELIINNKHGKIEVVQHAGEELEVVVVMKAVANTDGKRVTVDIK